MNNVDILSSLCTYLHLISTTGLDWNIKKYSKRRSLIQFGGGLFLCEHVNTVWSAFWDPKSAPNVFKGLWGCWRLSRAEQRDICPGLEGFHASGRPDDLGPPGLPAERGSQRVNLTQMDPHADTEHTHTRRNTHVHAHIRGYRQMQVWTYRSANTLIYRNVQPHMYRAEHTLL